ncbi:alpha-mannosidase [Paenibacillus chungangensis]|uniref:Alpha-mannosidase n=1 Tax=Paenibacillus chungangensis TaxID=696535 RepID=A0ABW3HX21_9BACL
MFLTEEKLRKRIDELRRYRYDRTFSVPIGTYRFWEDKEADVGAMPPSDAEWTDISIGDRWEGWDKTVWLQAESAVPAAWAGRRVVGLFDIGKSGGGNTTGFESLLYLNGQPYQGVDSNHQEVLLPQGLAGQKVSLLFKVWSGIYGWTNDKIPLVQQLKQSELTVVHEAADDLYFTAEAAYRTLLVLDKNSWERQQILNALDRAFLLLNWRKPGSEMFYASVGQACSQLKEELGKLPKHHAVKVRCIGHSHIDVAWLWRLRHTREKAARTFSTVLRLMEQFPEYVFLQSQPQLYADLERDYPDIFDSIRQRVKEGRWEAGGAMWLESDCNVPSGESLVRQLLHGTRYFEAKFGVACRYLWLPDVFGYSWALPQILKKCEIDTFMTTKISWNVYNKMPHDTFIWRGIDGSEVLTHFITTPDPHNFKADNVFKNFYTYNGEVLPETVIGIWNAYRDKEINDDLLLAFGWGDGGGGPTRDMLEMRRRLEHMPGLPTLTTGRADEYFEELNRTVEETDRYVHRWEGELYLELHRGTYTSQAYNKRMNRRLEQALRSAEMIASGGCSAISSASYPQSRLYEAWTIVLRNQFHDILPGSSITEVYEDCRVEYAEAEALVEGVLKEGLQLLASSVAKGAEPGWLLFNSLGWERDESIELPWSAEYAGKRWRDGRGRRLEAERISRETGDRLLLHVRDIPANGYAMVSCDTEGDDGVVEGDEAIVLTEGGASTPFYDIRWNEAGQLTRLYDKLRKREVIAEGCTANRFDVHEDKPAEHEVWEIDLFYKEKVVHIDDLQSIEVIEHNRQRAIIRFQWRYGETSLKQDMTLYAELLRIDFATHVNWQERQQLLKVAFPVDVRAAEATYEIQFGNVKRPTHWNTSWDYARFETCAQSWVDLSERGFGVSLMNDCKYGHDVLDNVMRITLIKSGIAPDPYADLGEHLFTYSVMSHGGDWFEGGTLQQAHRLNAPIAAVKLPDEAAADGLPHEASFIHCSSPNIIIDTFKKSEDDEYWILRCYEAAGQKSRASFHSWFPIDSLQEVNMLERDGVDMEFAEKEFKASFGSYEVKTFKVSWR